MVLKSIGRPQIQHNGPSRARNRASILRDPLPLLRLVFIPLTLLLPPSAAPPLCATGHRYPQVRLCLRNTTVRNPPHAKYTILASIVTANGLGHTMPRKLSA